MRCILLILVFVLSVRSFALVRMALQGGLSASNAVTDPSQITSARGGLALGAALEFGTGGNWKLQIEGIYSNKGYEVPATSETVRLDYVEFPLLLKYPFNLVLLKPFLVFGPYLSFLTKADSVLGSTTTALTGYRPSDLGFVFGGGVEIAFTPITGIFALLRYDLGLLNVISSGSGSHKNRGLVLLGGFFFSI